jgi:hypothetical protein
MSFHFILFPPPYLILIQETESWILRTTSISHGMGIGKIKKLVRRGVMRNDCRDKRSVRSLFPIRFPQAFSSFLRCWSTVKGKGELWYDDKNIPLMQIFHQSKNLKPEKYDIIAHQHHVYIFWLQSWVPFVFYIMLDEISPFHGELSVFCNNDCSIGTRYSFGLIKYNFIKWDQIGNDFWEPLCYTRAH